MGLARIDENVAEEMDESPGSWKWLTKMKDI